MKNKILKILGVVATIAMLSSFAVAPASAAIGTNAWGQFTMPTVNPISAIDQLEIAPDGTLYASVARTSDGLPGDGDFSGGGGDTNEEWWTMYKSIDNGVTWEATELDYLKIGDDVRITAIAAAADGMIYVAVIDMVTGEARVWKCPDEGEADPFPLQALIDNQANVSDYVYDLEVWTDGVSNWVMAACHIDVDITDEYAQGEVLVLRDGLFEPWRDMDLSSSFPFVDTVTDGIEAAYKAKFAPDFDTSFMIWALISYDDPGTGDEEYILTATGANSPGAWGTVIKNAYFDDYTALDDDAGALCDFAFEDGYDGDNPIIYAALNDSDTGSIGDGNLFLVEFAFVVDTADTEWLAMLDNRAMCSVGIAHNYISAGALLNNIFYISTNGGDTFDEPTKAPTGYGQVRIYLPADYDPDTDFAFITTRRAANDESALSRSNDGGDTWNQIAFIDTTIDEVVDMTWTPDFPAAGSYMLVLTRSYDTGCLSLWRSGNATSATPFWERVLCAADNESWRNFDMETSLSDALIEWSEDGSTVMLFGYNADDDPTVFRSSDDAQTFNQWRTVPEQINDWVVLDSVTFYAAMEVDDPGEYGFYARGAFGPPMQELEDISCVSIDLQPGFLPNDSAKDTLVLGSEDTAMIYVSNDGGESFGAGDSVAAVGTGDVLVDFDNLSATTIYFATSGSAVGVATIGPTTTSPATATNRLTGIMAYEDSEGDTADAAQFSGIWVSPDNTLYALGGNEVVDEYEDVLYAWGKVLMDNDGGGGTAAGSAIDVDNNNPVGDAQVNLDGPGSLDFTDLSVEDFLLVPTGSDSFEDNEALSISGTATLYAISDSIIAGTIYVVGDSVDETGFIDVVFVGLTGLTAGQAFTATEDAATNDWFVDTTETAPWAMVMGAEVVTDEGTLSDGDTPDVTAHNVMVDTFFPTMVGGWIALENPVLDKGRAYVEWDADFGFANEDLGMTLDDFDASTIQLVEIEVYTGTSGDTNVYLWRILIGEDDNIWETAQKNGAYGLWGTKGSNILWTVASPASTSAQNNAAGYTEVIWALKDIMSGKVLGLNVTNITATSAKANWTAMTGATQYQLKWDTVVNTSDSPVTATTASTSYTMSSLTNNTKYTVKVRVTAGSPFQSRWSDSVEFTTLETVGAPSIITPAYGQLNSPLNQTLNWSPVTGAKSYDVEVAATDDFTSPIVTANTANTIYHLANLAYDTDYAWRVRAVGATGAKGAWVIGTFHTMAEAITPTTTIPTYTMTVDIPPATNTTVVISQPPATSIVIPPATTFTQTITSQTVTAVVQLPDNAAPAYVWAIVAIGALLTLAVIVLIIRTRRVV